LRRHHRSGAPLGLEQPDLAEEVARAELGDALAVAEDGHGSLLDHEELVGERALLGELHASRERQLVRPRGYARALALRQRREEPDGGEPIRIHVPTLDVRRTAAQWRGVLSR